MSMILVFLTHRFYQRLNNTPHNDVSISKDLKEAIVTQLNLNRFRTIQQKMISKFPILWSINIIVPLIIVIIFQMIIFMYFQFSQIDKLHSFDYQELFSILVFISIIPLIYWYKSLKKFNPYLSNGKVTVLQSAYSFLLLFLTSFAILFSTYYFCQTSSERLKVNIDESELLGDIKTITLIENSFPYQFKRIFDYSWRPGDIEIVKDTTLRSYILEKIEQKKLPKDQLSMNRITKEKSNIAKYSFLLLKYEIVDTLPKYKIDQRTNLYEIDEGHKLQKERLNDKLLQLAKTKYIGLQTKIPMKGYIVILFILCIAIDINRTSGYNSSTLFLTISMIILLLQFVLIAMTFDGLDSSSIEMIAMYFYGISLFLLVLFLFSLIRKRIKKIASFLSIYYCLLYLVLYLI